MCVFFLLVSVNSVIIGKDVEGNVVCLSDHIPENFKLQVEAVDRAPDTFTAGGQMQALGRLLGLGSQDRDEIRQAHFRGTVNFTLLPTPYSSLSFLIFQVLKLENIQAHLANERTWYLIKTASI